MKARRFQYEYRKSASKRHKLVGEILRNSLFFKNYESYQEYPVNKINPLYESGREHFDWVVKELQLVIEVMGSQHFTPTSFGGNESAEETIARFKEQQVRDEAKKQAAIDAGWTYIAFDPKEPITDEIIMQRYKENFVVANPIIKYNIHPQKPKPEKSEKQLEWETTAKEKAREIRKQRYQFMKEQKKLRGQTKDLVIIDYPFGDK